MLCAIMHPQAASNPKPNSLVNIYVPRILTVHTAMIFTANENLVSPAPCNMPSRTFDTPKNGSEQATMRRTVLQSAMTAMSLLNSLTMEGAKINRRLPVNTIIRTSQRIVILDTL